MLYPQLHRPPILTDFPPLTDEQLGKVVELINRKDPQKLLSGEESDEKLIEKYNLPIYHKHIHTLRWNPPKWLNDQVINFYLEMICERNDGDDNLLKVHTMSTDFANKLRESAYEYDSVKRWAKIDIFAKDIVLIPVNMNGNHWCMAIIYMGDKTIKYYDSKGGKNPDFLMKLFKYLEAEFKYKNMKYRSPTDPFDETVWRLENVQGIPQQSNDDDCGVFSCMYAEFVSRNRPITQSVFSQANMTYFRKRMLFEICLGYLIQQ